MVEECTNLERHSRKYASLNLQKLIILTNFPPCRGAKRRQCYSVITSHPEPTSLVVLPASLSRSYSVVPPPGGQSVSTTPVAPPAPAIIAKFFQNQADLTLSILLCVSRRRQSAKIATTTTNRERVPWTPNRTVEAIVMF